MMPLIRTFKSLMFDVMLFDAVWYFFMMFYVICCYFMLFVVVCSCLMMFVVVWCCLLLFNDVCCYLMLFDVVCCCLIFLLLFDDVCCCLMLFVVRCNDVIEEQKHATSNQQFANKFIKTFVPCGDIIQIRYIQVVFFYTICFGIFLLSKKARMYSVYIIL